MIMGKDKQIGGSKPPPYVMKLNSPLKMLREAPPRCTDIFLCIYCEFRICLTNASGDAHTPI